MTFPRKEEKMLKRSGMIDYLKLTICSIIFIVIFYFNYRSITFSLVFTVLAMLWFGFLFNSRKPMKINKEVYIRLLAFSVMTVISFGVAYLLKKEKLCYLPGLGALTLNLIWVLCIKRNRNKGTTQCDYNKLLQRVDSNDVLFDAQKEDLKTILKYLNDFNIIGINSYWGMGKTYLIDALLGLFKEDSNSYELLQIDLLSFDLDKIEDVVINGVEDILYKNGIYSSVGRRIRKLLGKTSWAEPFLSLFCDTTSSLADAYNELVDKVTHLNKTIVIVVEDIDRLIVTDSNKKAIDLIFGIAEKLTTYSLGIPTSETKGRIKIIFQYDFNMLKGQFDFINRYYLEKYIPHEINLTPVPYEIVARKLLQETKSTKDLSIEKIIKHTTNGKISSNDIALIDYGLDSQTIVRIAPGLHEITINKPFYVAYSIRVVERYLDELSFTYKRLQDNLWITDIGQNNYYSSIKECYMLIAKILYVKHFYPELYYQLREGTPPYESWKVEWKNSWVSVKEMLLLSVQYDVIVDTDADTKKDRDKYLSELQNNTNLHARLWILLFLGYRLDAFSEWSKKFDLPWNNLNKDILQEINKKNDRIIWHMLWSGESANTDNEILLSLVKKKVLDVKSEEQAEAWENLCLDVQNRTLRNGTRPLYFPDLNLFYPVFYAFYIAETNEAYWQAIIDFYISNCKELLSRDVQYCNTYFNNLELIFKSVSSASTLMKVMAYFTENCSDFSIETIENNSYAKFLQLAMKFIKEKYVISHKWSKEEEKGYDFKFFRTYSPTIDSTVNSLLTSIKKHLNEQLPKEELNIVKKFITENITVIDKILEFRSRGL